MLRRLILRAVPIPPSAGGIGGLLLLAACALAPGPAAGAVPKPWVPPASDSLIAWSTEAKARFQTQRGDSATGANYRAYELVGRIVRRMLRSIGRESPSQVGVIDAVLDSVGLDGDVVTDPATPNFVLVMVRNPYRLTADAVGFLYWYAADDLRMQGVVMRGGFRPRMRVWWTGSPEGPYEWGILDQERDPEGSLELLFMRLTPGGRIWSIVQYEDDDRVLGRGGEAYWVDINHDDLPEIVSWSRAAVDSTFEECPNCPHLMTERTLTRRDDGFALHDSRLLPSPYATFVLFIRLLREGNRAAAARLLEDPRKLDQAIALGWNAPARPGQWRLEFAEPNQPWPRWLGMRYKGAAGRPVTIVRFAMKDARWIIQDWGVSRGRGGKSAEIGVEDP